MLSQTAEYALRAVLHLADRPQEGPMPVDRIASALGLPRNYLAKTLHVLAREGILASSRGPGGGFVLGAPPEDLTLAAVVAPFEGTGAGRSCLLGRSECSDRDPCPAHHRWTAVSERVATFFRESTVASLLEDGAAGRRPPVASPAPAGEEPRPGITTNGKEARDDGA